MRDDMSERWRAIAAAARKDAEKLRSDAGYSGSMTDGGSGALLMAVEAWEAGLASRVPSSLAKYAVTAEREADPEWATFQRLRQKFGPVSP